jgi:hypothetical protein
MNIRKDPIYLSREVSRMLWMDAKAKGPVTDGQGLQRVMTGDEIADTIIRAYYQKNYPMLLEHLKAVEKMQKEVIKTLGKTT